MTQKLANIDTMLSRLRHKALSAAIEERKISNGLVVKDATTRDSSILSLSKNTLETLQLSQGDTVLVRGKNKKNTVLVVLVDDYHDSGSVHMNLTVRQNLHVELGDVVTILPCPDIKFVKRVAIQCLDNDTEDSTDYLFDNLLAPYFHEAYRPLRKGDSFTCRAAMRTANFKVIEIDPPEYGIVTQDTFIHWDVTKALSNGSWCKRLDRALKSFFGLQVTMRANKTIGRKPREMLSKGRLEMGYPNSSSTEALIKRLSIGH